ncbi:hypothetical protein GUJ93_ZPchr0013g34350 [Zizania palustris]|uniref:Uncharacterized protein n=1 Tax=Zizania palustris TaxID=103762 RepID=A0A8J6BYH5_ZIZPA|nr:hypothetical protein GUJ93_ZPchr0013g34350 [Zizania palustris]
MPMNRLVGELELRPPMADASFHGLVGWFTMIPNSTPMCFGAWCLATSRIDDCIRVLSFSSIIKCAGVRVCFSRWSRLSGAKSKELPYLSKIGIDGFSAHAWDLPLVKQLLNVLECQLVELLPVADEVGLDMLVWVSDPNRIPKGLELIFPDPEAMAMLHASSVGMDVNILDNAPSATPLVPPAMKCGMAYNLIVHVMEVVDPLPLTTMILT